MEFDSHCLFKSKSYYAIMPPMIAPSKIGPIWEIDKTTPPKPAITPISGMPVKLDANKKRAIPNIIQGKNTAIRAEPTDRKSVV